MLVSFLGYLLNTIIMPHYAFVNVVGSPFSLHKLRLE